MKLSNYLNGSPELTLLVDKKGVSYNDFLKKLQPNYFLVYCKMIIPMLFLIIFSFFLWHENVQGIAGVLFLILGPFYISFWKAAYMLHMHEGAHWNIHKSKILNDWIANLLLTPFTGIWIKEYRKSHWLHHRFLGTHLDTEISYLTPINAVKFLESLTGIYLLIGVFRYFKNFLIISKDNKKMGIAKFISSLLLMLIFQIGIVAFFILNDSILLGLIWLASIFITDPFFGKLRQTLEHRSYQFGDDADFSAVEHGPINRNFGNDFFQDILVRLALISICCTI